jgi:hypothetical protein
MTSLRDLPLFAALGDAQRILVVGAGGGFDIYGGIPLALALRDRGAEVVLANLTRPSWTATRSKRSSSSTAAPTS